MIIELNTIYKGPVFIAIDKISSMRSYKGENKVFSQHGDYWIVKETPQQIQELILLDEFAKVALNGLFSNSDPQTAGLSIDETSKVAYDIAQAMIEARKEALK